MIKNAINACLLCKNPSCVNACPLHNNIPFIIKSVKENKLEEGYKELTKTNVFPYLCGILCPNEKYCMGKCLLNQHEYNVNISQMEFELSEMFSHKISILDNKLTGLNVAVVGGGISGLTAAIDLARSGAQVTIYEKKSYLGGPLVTYLSEKVLEKDYFEKITKIVEELNIRIKYNKELGVNLFVNKLNDYDFVIYALGTDKMISSFDEYHPSVKAGCDILEQIKLGTFVKKHNSAILVGSSKYSVDVARELNSYGIKVTLIFNKELEYTGVSLKDIKKIEDLGVNVLHSCIPVDLLIEDGEVIGIVVEKLGKTSNVDRSGRPIFNRLGIYETIEAEMVVDCGKLVADLSYLEASYPFMFKQGVFNSDEPYLRNHNVFVIGDFVAGHTDLPSNISAALKVKKGILANRKYYMFGGSFDPVTNAHVELIRYVISRINPEDIIYVVPNGDGYNFGGKNLTPFKIRKEMLEEAFKEFTKNVVILDVENTDRFDGIYQTLRKLNHPKYIIGSDLLYSISQWKSAETLLKENSFLVINREDYSANILNTDLLLNRFIDKFEVTDYTIGNVSSTLVRSLGKLEYTTEGVRRIIKKYHLYEEEVK